MNTSYKLQLDSPEYKKLLNEMCAVECNGLSIDLQHGHVSRRLYEVRILRAQMQGFQGSTLFLSRIPA